MSFSRRFVQTCVLTILGAAVAATAQSAQNTGTTSTVTHHIKYVWVIVMENHNWTGGGSLSIKGNPEAPYINYDLIPNGAHANNYWNPPHEHPSLGNYLWMEAGTDFGINGPILTARTVKANTQFTHLHLVWQLMSAGKSWKAYPGDPFHNCPVYQWVTAQVFFADITDVPHPGVNPNPYAPVCLAHVVPLSDLAGDLAKGTAPDYSNIVPDNCDSMHTLCNGVAQIKAGDDWLKATVPLILNSKQYKEGGALFITWDEAAVGDGPIPMIVMSPFAKPGYGNSIHYTHGSLLRTVEEIFNLPLLGNANQEPDLSNLFSVFP